MGKIFGILVIVVGIWVGLEVYTEGTQHAFGGKLSFLSKGEPAGEGESGGRRVRSSVERSHEEHAERFKDALGE